MTEKVDQIIIAAYGNAGKRLLLLDYDGTLVPFAPTPSHAAPTPKLLALLEQLAADSRNTIALVSGRPRYTLDEWFGHLPIFFTAEHGLAWRKPEQKWQSLVVDTTWKPEVYRHMQTAVTAVPGSFIE